MNTILIISASIFAFSSLFFFVQRVRYDSDLPWLVSFITLISFFVLIMNVNSAQDPISMLWTRWVGYAVSCTLLTATMNSVFNLTQKKQITTLICTPLIMLTGVLADISTTPLFIILFFALGILPFIVLIQTFQSEVNIKNAPFLNYIYFGWMAFPLLFILSPETFTIIPSITVILTGYLLADIVTKIIFYIHIHQILSRTKI